MIPSKTFEEFGEAWLLFVSGLQGTVYLPDFSEKKAKEDLKTISAFSNMQLGIADDILWIMDEWQMIPCDAESLEFVFDEELWTLVLEGTRVNNKIASQVYTIEEMLTSDSEILRKVASLEISKKMDLDFEITRESKG